MNAYETTLQLDEPQLTLPESFRNKKVRVVVEEVEESEKPRKHLDFALIPFDIEKYPFDRGLLYDEDGHI